jgi:transposase
MSGKRKYSDQQRLDAVLDVLEKGVSLCEVARRLGTDHKNVRRWVAFYEQYGVKGICPIKRKVSYSGDFKLSVVRHMRENHLSLFEAALKFGIPNDSVVLTWDRLYESEGASALYQDNRGKMKKPNKQKQSTRAKSVESAEDELLEELEYLRAENAYLKKLKALVEQRVSRESGNVPKPSKD